MGKPELIRAGNHDFVICVPKGWKEKHIRTWIEENSCYEIPDDPIDILEYIAHPQCTNEGHEHKTINTQISRK